MRVAEKAASIIRKLYLSLQWVLCVTCGVGLTISVVIATHDYYVTRNVGVCLLFEEAGWKRYFVRPEFPNLSSFSLDQVKSSFDRCDESLQVKKFNLSYASDGTIVIDSYAILNNDVYSSAWVYKNRDHAFKFQTDAIMVSALFGAAAALLSLLKDWLAWLLSDDDAEKAQVE